MYAHLRLVISVLAATHTIASADPPKSEPQREPIEYGIGLRARAVHIHEGLLELLMERAAGPAKGYGFGIELARRRGNLELQLGAEFEYVQPAEGVYIEDGKDVSAARGDEADFILSPDHNGGNRLGWVTVEFSFINHAELTDYLAIRYGAGLGVGFVRGKLGRYDMICNDASNEVPAPGCVPSTPPFDGSGTFSDDGGRVVPGTIATYDLPKILPVVTAIIGIQVRPFKKMTVNVEGGIRTIPFVGVSTAFFF